LPELDPDRDGVAEAAETAGVACAAGWAALEAAWGIGSACAVVTAAWAAESVDAEEAEEAAAVAADGACAAACAETGDDSDAAWKTGAEAGDAPGAAS
jgi:hypothetical protein